MLDRAAARRVVSVALPQLAAFPAARPASHVHGWCPACPLLPADMLEIALLEAGMKAHVGGAAGMC